MTERIIERLLRPIQNSVRCVDRLHKEDNDKPFIKGQVSYITNVMLYV